MDHIEKLLTEVFEKEDPTQLELDLAECLLEIQNELEDSGED